jgi:hypothetical protein
MTRKIHRRSNVSRTESTNEPRQPSRLEKKRNNHAGCPTGHGRHHVCQGSPPRRRSSTCWRKPTTPGRPPIGRSRPAQALIDEDCCTPHPSAPRDAVLRESRRRAHLQSATTAGGQQAGPQSNPRWRTLGTAARDVGRDPIRDIRGQVCKTCMCWPSASTPNAEHHCCSWPSRQADVEPSRCRSASPKPWRSNSRCAG